LISDNKNVLILDTCCLLDVVRVPIHNQIPILEAAIKIITDYNSGVLNYNIVIPSLVEKEWDDNIVTISDEVVKKVQETKKFFTIMKDTTNKLGLSPEFTFINPEAYQIEQVLSRYSYTILDNAVSLQDTLPEFMEKGWRRVVQNIPPSKKGKESTKDCTIFEEVLAIGDSLIQGGFTEKIIFASSNTKEYQENGKTIQSIKEELDLFNIKYASSLNHGLYLVT
jgi:hypothetical protein